MADKLDNAFRNYANVIRSKLRQRSKRSRVKGHLHLLVNKVMELNPVVKEMENGAEFRQLVKETRSLFSGLYPERGEEDWYTPVQLFFRRSGYYVDLLEGRIVSTDAMLRKYRKAFQRQKTKISYLAPIEFVHFAAPCIDCGSFQIRRFSADELEEILQKRVREVIFPVWTPVDVKLLEGFWFVYLTETVPKSKRWIPGEYTRYPKVFELTLQHLALFDWQPDWLRNPPGGTEYTGWEGFKIPFPLRVDDDLLSGPYSFPDLSKLETDPIFDSQTGKLIGEEPVTYFHFNKDETESFSAFMQHTGNLLASVRARENGWHFLDIAMGYLIKAFFAGGLEQLLWHIIVLEALLGEKKEGVTERLARRIGSIMGKTKNERKKYRDQFKQLYELRCDLVHGRPFQRQITDEHLWNARDLARGTVLWFIHYLGNIQAVIPNDHPIESLPTREDILLLLDLEYKNRSRVARLIDNLPAGFPYVQEWI